MQSELDWFLRSLRKNGMRVWLNTYFNWLQLLLQSLDIKSDSPALAMNVTKDFGLHTNIGQRWITKPYEGKYIGLLFPIEEDETLFYCKLHFYFGTNNVRTVKFVLHALKENEQPSQKLFTLWHSACKAELDRTTKSGYKRFHSDLFYETVMNNELREEIFAEAFSENCKESPFME
ncbi:MAG: hypothetical protein ABI266_07410 [Ginsengibacter sp.]